MNSASFCFDDADSKEIESDFNTATNLLLKKDVHGSKLTTFRIGGAFKFYIEPNSVEELCQIIKWCTDNSHRYSILGAGSNLLVNSLGVNSLVLHLGRFFKNLEIIGDTSYRVGAAYSLTSLSRELSLAGLSGLEFASGIPASIGGATRMNAGAHGSEISSILTSIEGVDAYGKIIQLQSSELDFRYRSCSLPSNFIVTSIDLKLVDSDATSVMQCLSKNLEYRKNTQPLTQPSAGSVFKNPNGPSHLSAGAIIENLGLKGHSHGGAQISDKHANWITNPLKTATSSDVVALIDLCKNEARERFAQELQTEIVMW